MIITVPGCTWSILPFKDRRRGSIWRCIACGIMGKGKKSPICPCSAIEIPRSVAVEGGMSEFKCGTCGAETIYGPYPDGEPPFCFDHCPGHVFEDHEGKHSHHCTMCGYDPFCCITARLATSEEIAAAQEGESK